MLGLHLTGRFSPRFFFACELPQPRSGSGARPSGHRVPSDDLSDRGQIEGESTPVSPGNVIEYEVPDMYGRPWEEGMEQPEDDDIFSFE